MLRKYTLISIITLLLSSCSVFKKDTVSEKDLKTERQELDFQFYFFEGNKQKMLGNMEQAGACFLKCLSIRPKSAAANYELAKILFMAEDYSNAINYAQKAYEADTDNKWYNALCISLTKALGDYKKASEMLEEMLQKHPDDYNSYLELTDLYLHLNKSEKALEILNRFEKQYGFTEALMVEKNRIHIRKKDFDSARKEVSKMIKQEPGNTSYQIIFADLYAEEGQYDKAYELYQDILKEDPDNGSVHFSLSEYYHRIGDEKQSFKELKQAFDSEEVLADLKVQLLMSYLKINNPSQEDKEQVYELIDIMLSRYPENVQVHTLYSDMLVKDKQYKAAQEELKWIVEKTPDKYAVWEQLLFVDNQLSDFENLYKNSVKMIEYFPNQSIAYFFAGLGGYQIAKYQESVEYLEAGADFALEDSSLQAQFQTLIGDSYHRLKNDEKSDKAYEKAINLNPDNYYVYNNYAYFLALRKTKLSRAESLMEKCIAKHPKNATYLDTYAWVLYQKGDFEKALEMIERAYQNGGKESTVIVEHYGDILYKTKQHKSAIERWKEAQEIGKGSDKLESKIKSGKLIED